MRPMNAEAVEASATPAAVATLTGRDRCDRCGSQAYLRATFPKGGTLLLCAHHGRANVDALRKAGAYITDETDFVPV